MAAAVSQCDGSVRDAPSMIKIGRRTYTDEEVTCGMERDWTPTATDKFWAVFSCGVIIVGTVGGVLMYLAGFR